VAGKKPKSTKQRKTEERFKQDLLSRGEAVERVNGKLPPGATHEIVGKDSKGNPKIVRRRFSAF